MWTLLTGNLDVWVQRLVLRLGSLLHIWMVGWTRINSCRGQRAAMQISCKHFKSHAVFPVFCVNMCCKNVDTMSQWLALLPHNKTVLRPLCMEFTLFEIYILYIRLILSSGSQSWSLSTTALHIFRLSLLYLRLISYIFYVYLIKRWCLPDLDCLNTPDLVIKWCAVLWNLSSSIEDQWL